jgi:iduronate 2-sulfatase
MALIWPVAACGQDQSTSRKLNVLFIAIDDLNNSLGCYGSQVVKSPHIDRLAKRGIRFDRAYCQYPLCNPSRTSLLSGKRPSTTGVYDNATSPRANLKDALFLPQLFRKSGYFTARADKIFHIAQGGSPSHDDPACWDKTVDVAAEYYPERRRLRQHVTRSGPQWAELDAADDKTGDGTVARSIAKLMEEASSTGKPFFLAAGFRKPHAQYVAPKRYFDLYKLDQIALPNEPPEHRKSIPSVAFTPLSGLNEQEQRETILAYYACVSFVDAQVGVLLDTLDRLKLWDDTVVVLFGDHGYHLGEHGGMWHKMSLFEESARAPLIVYAPRAKGNGRACPRTVEFVDLYPTLTDLCGLASPSALQGTSLRLLLADPQAKWDRPAYTMVFHQQTRGESVRTERYRYVEWDRGEKGKQLYDHSLDPREYRNLADDPAHAKTVEEMKRLLDLGRAPGDSEPRPRRRERRR